MKSRGNLKYPNTFLKSEMKVSVIVSYDVYTRSDSAVWKVH